MSEAMDSYVFGVFPSVGGGYFPGSLRDPSKLRGVKMFHSHLCESLPHLPTSSPHPPSSSPHPPITNPFPTRSLSPHSPARHRTSPHSPTFVVQRCSSSLTHPLRTVHTSHVRTSTMQFGVVRIVCSLPPSSRFVVVRLVFRGMFPPMCGDESNTRVANIADDVR